MPEETEVEPHRLQEELNEKAGAGHGAPWLRYVGLTAAIFAVVAAVAALRSSSLINEATIDQIRASDTWNEYQADRQKQHLYEIALDEMMDRNSKNLERMRYYRAQIAAEAAKEKPLSAEARKIEEGSAQDVERHHAFENAVGLLQVGIALGAVAALALFKPAWYVSIVAGVAGIVAFVWGFVM